MSNERTVTPYARLRGCLSCHIRPCETGSRAAEHGPGGICDQKRDGPECRLNPGQLGRLRVDLIAGPQKCGFDHGIWAARSAVAHIRKRFGVQCAERGMYDLLNRIGFSSKRPRPRHPGAASEHDKNALKKKLTARPSTAPERATGWWQATRRPTYWAGT